MLMAFRNFIYMDIEGEDAIMTAFTLIEERAKRETARYMDAVADESVSIMRRNEHRSTGYLREHTGRSPIKWRPGGAGGGGEHEVVMGVRAGSSQHPFYVESGTGIYAGRPLIRPKTGEFMYFWSNRYGKRIRVRFTKGQRAQHYFLQSWLLTRLYAQARFQQIRLLQG